MDRYPYLEYIVLLDERTLARLGNLHFLLHIFKTQSRNAFQVFGTVAGDNFYFIVVFMLISTLSTSLVLQTFFLI